MLGGWRVGLGWRALAWAWVCEVLLRCVGRALHVPFVPWCLVCVRGRSSFALFCLLVLLRLAAAGSAPAAVASCTRVWGRVCVSRLVAHRVTRVLFAPQRLMSIFASLFFFTQSLKQSACRSNSLTKRQRRRSPLDSSLSAILNEGKVPRNVRAALANLDVWAWRRKGQTKWQSAGADQNAPNKPKQGPPASQRRSQVARSLPRGVPGKRVLLHTCHQDKRSRRQNSQPCRVLTGGRRGVPH